ncbi:uncharacterized protein LOC121432240 [Lytechinus variegatus]|uniref:uncharacterized protein LOC121432240 n=1 Tax=Lytechinus variegatus TaxID=7654 RepID=UPI001BB0F98C|nr:uncharacterized protein LOC121432240 [Lytechinus variegatus]
MASYDFSTTILYAYLAVITSLYTCHWIVHVDAYRIDILQGYFGCSISESNASVICKQTNVVAVTMKVQYTINELYALRNAPKPPLSPNSKQTVIECGIRRKRGTRGGKGNKRNIPVRVISWGKPRFQRQSGVNYENLVFVPTSDFTIITKTRNQKPVMYDFPTLYMANLRSIANKFDELYAVIKMYKVDVCAISESWLNNDEGDTFCIDGYIQLSKSRSSRRGGGVLVYARDDLYPKPVTNIRVPDNLEVIWIQLRPRRLPREVSSLFVAVVYSPPNSNSETELIDHIIDSVDVIRSRHPYAGIAILGDFNRVDTDGICTAVSLKQIVEEPTRNDAILDKIITNLQKYYKKCEIKCPVGTSDHNAILWCPLPSFAHRPNTTMRRTVRPMKDSDTRAFGRWISTYSWTEVHDAVSSEVKCNAFCGTLKSAMDHFFPLKRVNIHERDKPWG